MPGDPTSPLQVCDPPFHFVIVVAATYKVKKVLKSIYQRTLCCTCIVPILLVLCVFRYDKYCADHYGNGICDQSCYTEACGWDGLDCSADTPPKVLDGTLVIVVRLQPKELLGDLRGFLRSLGALLHTNVQVKLNETNQPMVYPYYGEEVEHGRQRSRSKRELEREVIG